MRFVIRMKSAREKDIVSAMHSMHFLSRYGLRTEQRIIPDHMPEEDPVPC